MQAFNDRFYRSWENWSLCPVTAPKRNSLSGRKKFCYSDFTEKASREIAHRKHTGRSKSLAPLCEVKVSQSCPALWGPTVCIVHGISPGQSTGVGSLFLLQETFPTQLLNPGLPHCRQILYELSHQGSPRILEWVAHPFPSGSSWPRNRTGVAWIAGRFFCQLSCQGSSNWISYLLRPLLAEPSVESGGKNEMGFTEAQAQHHGQVTQGCI